VAASRHLGKEADVEAAQLRAVVEGIPEGRWMSYADVVAAAGGSPRQAVGLHRRLDRKSVV